MNNLKPIFVSLAATSLFSVAASAQATATGDAARPAGTTTSTTATTATSTTVAPAAAKPEEVGISARDGITVSGTDVLITRNRVSEKLEKELTLENGLRVKPDGTVQLPDGSKITLRGTQVLTFDGKLMDVQPTAGPQPNTTTTTTVTEAVPATGSSTTTTKALPGGATHAAPAGAVDPSAKAAADAEAERRARAAGDSPAQTK